MPELPDLNVYQQHLERRIRGQVLEDVRLASLFVLRTAQPPLDAVIGTPIRDITRIGKQIVFTFDDELHLVIHLMIAGRLRWRDAAVSIRGRNVLGAFDFGDGSLLFTEASKKKRASLRVVDRQGLADLDLGGLELAAIDAAAFTQRLHDSGHTLKRALTDQRVIAGIGNAYSDEILVRAGMSPFRRASQLSADDGARLFQVCLDVVSEWTARLSAATGDSFPDKVTAFHPQMNVHGKYKEPCGICGASVQRIRYAENDANYCAACQTEGRLLADRSLSRLLKDNWPKRLEDLG
ncbi:MAG: DNA-formamidopyrimidine glycosylase family protein [Pseudomonadota bacterium]